MSTLEFVLKNGSPCPYPGIGKAPTAQPNAAAVKAKVLETFLAKSRPELLECE